MKTIRSRVMCFDLPDQWLPKYCSLKNKKLTVFADKTNSKFDKVDCVLDFDLLSCVITTENTCHSGIKGQYFK